MSDLCRVVSAMGWIALLAGCAGAPETGPIEVRWDRDVCARCGMAVGDRHYSAQVRGGTPPAPTAVSVFDDLGCAVLWLETREWRDDARTEIWVTSHETGKWLNARQAEYIDGRVSPMDFGLGAVDEPVEGSFGWDGAVARIREKVHTRGSARSAPEGVGS